MKGFPLAAHLNAIAASLSSNDDRTVERVSPLTAINYGSQYNLWETKTEEEKEFFFMSPTHDKVAIFRPPSEPWISEKLH